MSKIGLYSQQAVNYGCGTSIYRTPDGCVVEITAIYDEDLVGEYLWPDKISVGQVTEWVKQNVKFSDYLWKYYDV